MDFKNKQIELLEIKNIVIEIKNLVSELQLRRKLMNRKVNLRKLQRERPSVHRWMNR